MSFDAELFKIINILYISEPYTHDYNDCIKCHGRYLRRDDLKENESHMTQESNFTCYNKHFLEGFFESERSK